MIRKRKLAKNVYLVACIKSIVFLKLNKLSILSSSPFSLIPFHVSIIQKWGLRYNLVANLRFLHVWGLGV